MLSLRRLILILGLANLIVLGLIACSDDGVASDPAVEQRLEQLEAWRLLVEQRDIAKASFVRTQFDLNKDVQAALVAAAEHAVRMDASLDRQRAVLNQLADIVKDMLKREKK